MAKQYLQTQDIFNKVFQNQTGALRLNAYNSTQDYLNAVFDSAKDALRVKIDGVMLPVVGDVTELPDFADVNSICPVTPGDGYIYFYQWNGEEWIPLGGSGGGTELSPDQQIALQWVTENLSRLQELASADYIVQMETLPLTPANSQPVILNVQGEFQDIDDDGNLDGDETTHYRIDIAGYVMDVEGFESADSPQATRFLVKMSYDNENNVTHIYFTKEEYSLISSFPEGKNTVEVYYLSQE